MMKENDNLDVNLMNETSMHNDMKMDNQNTYLPIIGIGASAGGLESLIAFLGNVPENSGLAFVIVQHMEQLRKSILVDLLQSATTMKIVQVNENISIKPNCVYVIPPNKNMSISHKMLEIFDHIEPHTLQMTIDFFFHSLAEDQLERSIAVILSGMGTDGTAGIREIKEKGGVVFIQEPSSAKFDGMPRSAIDAGLADVIDTVENLPTKILSYLELKPHMDNTDQDLEDKLLGYFDTIMVLLRSKTGHDFSSYKKNTVHRRIERRMGIHQIEKIDHYVRYLQENPEELELLFKEFLIGVTSFFREPMEWDRLKEYIIPELLAHREINDTIRVWVSGCSTGEEAYSLAIAFNEVLDQLKSSKDFSMQIFATDLDIEAINKAREGVFSVDIEEEMTKECLDRYFIKVDKGYQVVKSIRDMVIFAQQNMIKDPPFTKIDILTCRNLLIYLTTEMQKKLIPLFHYSLNSGGFLFLGSAETVGNFTDLFNPLDRKSRIYRRLQPLLQAEHVIFPTSFAPTPPTVNQPSATVKNIQSMADKLILQHYSPATVLVNNKGDILYITGRTGKYLEPAAGNINWNIFAMAREGLYYKLSNAFFKSLKQKEAVTLNNITVINEGGAQLVDISVNPLQEPEELRGMTMIVFTDIVTPSVVETINTKERTVASSSKREEELERELMQTRQMWQVVSTEMQLSKEEYKSSNEELQSLNEQLKTVNFELQDKFEDLLLMTSDMKNQMDSMKIATLFLDNKLYVKHFTNQMSEVSRLIASDVGRPITDIASDLIYPELTEDVREVLRTLVTVEKQVVSYTGNWFNVRILPYQTLDDKIDGVVITYVNITKAKVLEAELFKAKLALEEGIINQGEALVLIDERLMDDVQLGLTEIAASKDTNLSK
jgi:two-component system CheB/CheR fusion protein